MELMLNKAWKDIPLGRYKQLRIEVTNMFALDSLLVDYPSPSLAQGYFTLSVNGHARRSPSVGLLDESWRKVSVVVPLIDLTMFNVSLHTGLDDRELGMSGAPITRLLTNLSALETNEHAFRLARCRDGIDILTDATIVLRFTEIEPYVGDATIRLSISSFHSNCSPKDVVVQPCLFIGREKKSGATKWPDCHYPLDKAIFNPSPEFIINYLGTSDDISEMGKVTASASNSWVIKRTKSITEAAAMEYVRMHTTIPVPRMKCSFEKNGYYYIIMEHIEGESLSSCYARMSAENLMSIAEQLGGFVKQLRSLSPRSTIGSWPFGPLDNQIFDPSPAHEFQQMDEWNAYWLWRIGPTMGDLESLPSTLLDSNPRQIYLSHGDLVPKNILVDENNRITAILDWETLGWYPDFWEATMACQGSPGALWSQNIEQTIGESKAKEYIPVFQDMVFRPWAY